MTDPMYRHTREEVTEWARERLAAIQDEPAPRRDFEEGRASAFIGIIGVLGRKGPGPSLDPPEGWPVQDGDA